jgi:IS30 family transposase
MRGHPLTRYEREKIEFFLRAHESVRSIGRMLHRDHAVIVRELRRNTCRDGRYRAEEAHAYAEARKHKRQKKKLETDEDLKQYVVHRLIDDQCSPEQIEGILKNGLSPRMKGKGVSHETIYRFIYEGQGRFMGLYQHLRRKRKKRQRRYARKPRGNQPVSFITPIQYRPEEINEKQRFGDWESDTTICEHKGGEAISVQYERSVQLARLTKVQDKTAESTECVWRELIEELPVESITMDRGGEGGNHWRIRLEYGIDTYHCDPYCSWQKGGVENLNGLIRQYIPKGTDLSSLSHHDIHVIQEKLNNRPRKSLGYKTPNQCYEERVKRGLQVVH